MSFLKKIFSPDPEIEKQATFQEIERQFKGDEINKAKAGWLTMRGNNYGMSRKLDKAISDFEEALQYEPNRPSTLVSLGAAYNHKRRWEDGISALEKAKGFLSSIESDFHRSTQEHNLYYELGNAYFFTDNKEQAIQNLYAALEAVDRMKTLRKQGKVDDEEWEAAQRMLAPMIKNTEWLLAKIR